MSCWFGLMFLLGVGLYGFNGMMILEYGSKGQLAHPMVIKAVIGVICTLGLFIDCLNLHVKFFKEK